MPIRSGRSVSTSPPGESVDRRPYRDTLAPIRVGALAARIAALRVGSMSPAQSFHRDQNQRALQFVLTTRKPAGIMGELKGGA
jgi:hypothetical protein